jgi:hypothetical protein
MSKPPTLINTPRIRFTALLVSTFKLSVNVVGEDVGDAVLTM